MGELINLAGYASTSRNKDQSLRFAFRNQDPAAANFNPERKSVLFHLDLSDGTVAGYCFLMNHKCFTRYPEEEEILLDDGRPFVVDRILRDQVHTEAPYKNKFITHIFLRSSLPKGIQLR